MIIVDASTMAEFLDPGSAVRDAVVGELRADSGWMIPEHGRLETASALRGLLLGGRLTRESFDRAMSSLATAELTACPTAPLLSRIAELAANTTVYDAAYIALAEALSAPIVTTDVKLSRVPGLRCEVRVVTT